MQFYLLFPLSAWFVLLKDDARYRIIIIIASSYAQFLFVEYPATKLKDWIAARLGRKEA